MKVRKKEKEYDSGIANVPKYIIMEQNLFIDKIWEKKGLKRIIWKNFGIWKITNIWNKIFFKNLTSDS